ncbi:MAG TPA: GIY-YIG nuclease family protein [Candidatus Saccharimonadia bacterium]|nr:GIY-YIG nuclease family protein [Candidatus Saccharimonadia bacterium]
MTQKSLSIAPPDNAMWFVYVLLCADQTLYTGIARDVQQRFLLHRKGKGAKYTKSHRPLRIVFTQEFPTRGDALKREHEIKTWSREEKIYRLSLSL